MTTTEEQPREAMAAQIEALANKEFFSASHQMKCAVLIRDNAPAIITALRQAEQREPLGDADAVDAIVEEVSSGFRDDVKRLMHNVPEPVHVYDRLVLELRGSAERSSDIQRQMAEAKSLRNSDGEHRDSYSWPSIAQTLEGRAADAIEALALRQAEAAPGVVMGKRPAEREHAFSAGWDAAIAWASRRREVAEAFPSSTVPKHDAWSDYDLSIPLPAALASRQHAGMEGDDAVIAEFAFLYREYGLEDDEKLAPDALELKRKVLAAIAAPATDEGAAPC